MNMNKNQPSVFLHDRPVGILKQMETGKKSFQYISNAIMPISINMPRTAIIPSSIKSLSRLIKIQNNCYVIFNYSDTI